MAGDLGAILQGVAGAIRGGYGSHLDTLARQRQAQLDDEAKRRADLNDLLTQVSLAQQGFRSNDQIGESVRSDLDATTPGVGVTPTAGANTAPHLNFQPPPEAPAVESSPELRDLGPRYIPVGNQGVIDQYATPAVRALRLAAAKASEARSLAEADRRRKAQVFTTAGLDPNKAAAVAEDSNLAPVLFKPATEPNKDAQIHARIIDLTGKGVPLDKASAQARLEFGETNASPDGLNSATRFQSDQSNKIIDDFARDTKDFNAVMQGWDVLEGATKHPSLATPFAITDAYARISNPGGVVRPTTQEMLENLGSLGQRMRKAWEKNATGGLPPDIIRDFQRTMHGIVLEHKRTFDRTRQMAIQRGKDAGVDVSPYLLDFTVRNPDEAPTDLPPLTDAMKARAASDPQYKAFKVSQGYTFP